MTESYTVDSIRADSINQLPEIVKGGGTFALVLELEPNNDTETIEASKIPSNNIFQSPAFKGKPPTPSTEELDAKDDDKDIDNEPVPLITPE